MFCARMQFCSWQTLFPDVIAHSVVSDAEAASPGDGCSAQMLTPADPFGAMSRCVYTPRQRGLTSASAGIWVFECLFFNKFTWFFLCSISVIWSDPIFQFMCGLKTLTLKLSASWKYGKIEERCFLWLRYCEIRNRTPLNYDVSRTTKKCTRPDNTGHKNIEKSLGAFYAIAIIPNFFSHPADQSMLYENRKQKLLSGQNPSLEMIWNSRAYDTLGFLQSTHCKPWRTNRIAKLINNYWRGLPQGRKPYNKTTSDWWQGYFPMQSLTFESNDALYLRCWPLRKF